jgi:hypothetical protein
MGREFYYKPGSFYRICDRTGFAFRAERTQSEWQGLIVSRKVWEIRQPQDYVRGVPDDQTVPYARPRSPNPFVGSSTNSQFQVYGDLPAERCFEVQGGKINVFKGIAVVTAASFPKSF